MKQYLKKRATVIALLLCYLGALSCVAEDIPAEELVWNEDKNTVFRLAQEQDKHIFLLVGRPTCKNCQNVIKLLNAPNGSLRSMIEENYILWYSFRDDASRKAEVKIYTAEFDTIAKLLPFLYVINPNKPEKIVTSAWGGQDAEALANILKSYSVSNEIIRNAPETMVSVAGNSLHISNNIEYEDIRIYTLTGQNVALHHKKGCAISIDASDLPKGLLIIHSSKGWSTKISIR